MLIIRVGSLKKACLRIVFRITITHAYLKEKLCLIIKAYL